MPIARFRGEFFFLSNFFPCRSGVEFESDVYPSSEHAYQAAKLEDAKLREPFTVDGSLSRASPLEVKRKGGHVKVRGGWASMKVKVMEGIARSKFQRDASLAAKLLATGDQKIVEGHTGDKFWGGKANHLGRILMKVRAELKVAGCRATDAGATACSDDDAADDAQAASSAATRKRSSAGRLEVLLDGDAASGERVLWVDREARLASIIDQCTIDFEMCGADPPAMGNFTFSVYNPASKQSEKIDARTALKDFAAEGSRVELTFTAAKAGGVINGADATGLLGDLESRPSEHDSSSAAECLADRGDGSLPPLFAAWLLASLGSELQDEAAAENLLIGAEVILGDGEASDGLANAFDLLVAEGAPGTAAGVEAQWAERWSCD